MEAKRIEERLTSTAASFAMGMDPAVPPRFPRNIIWDDVSEVFAKVRLCASGYTLHEHPGARHELQQWQLHGMVYREQHAPETVC